MAILQRIGLEEPAGILGEIITWQLRGISIRHLDLIAALEKAGLDSHVARELAPRNAFLRACLKLARDRVIRKVEEDPFVVVFQLTRETLACGKFEYEMETLLRLDKHSGNITCDHPELQALAREALDVALESRTTMDVSRIVQRIFQRHGDLFPIRESGGVYFVPQAHKVLTDRVEKFLAGLGGSLLRFPVPKGSARGDTAIQQTVSHGLEAMVRDHLEAIEGLGGDCRPETLERAAAKIQITRLKIAGYSEFLNQKREDLDRSLEHASELLRERLDQAIQVPEESVVLV